MDISGEIVRLRNTGASFRTIHRTLCRRGCNISLATVHNMFLRAETAAETGVHVGDCLTVLKRFDDNMFDCCVTSPPYYFVRDYGHGDDQIGLESDPRRYVRRLGKIFDEVRRVLKPTGTLWLDIADNYCTRRAIREDGKRTVVKGGPMRSWAEASAHGRTITGAQFRHLGVKEKDLFLIPFMIAEELRSRGWYLRADVIWLKPVAVPEPKRDRPTQSHEHVYMFTKRPSGYRYNSNANGRDVWEFPPSVFRSEHTAAMPVALAEKCISISSGPRGRVLDPFAGTGTTGVAAIRLGRKYDLVEANPHFANIARGRLGFGKE